MKLKNKSIIVVVATVVFISLGAFKSDWPAVQYFGNAAGVFLGFVLGVWWNEIEKERIRKEQEAEKSRIYKANVDRFWDEYKAFLLGLEMKVNYLKMQVAKRDGIYDTIIEYRLPFPEANYFQRQTGELALDKTMRQEIESITSQIRVIDEYMDFGAEKLKNWHGNFRILVDNLWVLIRDLNKKHSGTTAI